MSAELIEIRNQALDRLQGRRPRGNFGTVIEVRGNAVRARVPQARIGDICLLKAPSGDERMGEIVAIEGGDAVIACYSDVRGICGLTQVIPSNRPLEIPVGTDLRGKVIDAFGRPMSQTDPVPRFSRAKHALTPVIAEAPLPMERILVEQPFHTGIRVIDTMIATGAGQRIGIFGGAGAGKSSLISMLTNFSNYDVAVIGLIGERGREVREFYEQGLSIDVRDKCVVVASTSDRPAVERRLAGLSATAVAEAFADAGQNVLLIIDSLTRIARAQREIALSAGEPPSRRGFPPSTASFLAELVERAGPRRSGSITAFYSVLVEGVFSEDPIAEELKALLDGHIILSEKLGEDGQYPAIDVLASRSRLHTRLVEADHGRAAEHIRRLMAKHRDVELLLQIGEYVAGSDAVADEAIAKHDGLKAFFRQSSHTRADAADAISELIALAEA
jgi:type III secretion protein N (ATPase)